MYASAILSAAALLFGIVSASPVRPDRRQFDPFLGTGYLVNDDLGYVWTKLQEGNSSEGVPIGLSPLAASGPVRTQIFEMWENVDDSDTTTYLFAEADTGNYISLTQYTSSDDYSPGYWMLQTAPSQAGADYFTLIPGEQDGSWYIQTNPPSPFPAQLDWYHYDNSDASWIPIIVNTEYTDSSQSWTWVSA